MKNMLAVRRQVDLPMKLDEVVTGIHMARQIVNDRAAEICCPKISNLGGLSKARRVRDFLIDHGISVVSEDTWGGEITSAAVSHILLLRPLLGNADKFYRSPQLRDQIHRSAGTGDAGWQAFMPPMRQAWVFVADYESLGAPIAVYGG